MHAGEILEGGLLHSLCVELGEIRIGDLGIEILKRSPVFVRHGQPAGVGCAGVPTKHERMRFIAFFQILDDMVGEDVGREAWQCHIDSVSLQDRILGRPATLTMSHEVIEPEGERMKRVFCPEMPFPD